MPIDPSIALAYKSPVINSPLQNATAAMSLRDMMTQNALRQQQIQQSQAAQANLQAEANQKRADLTDQNTLKDGLLNDPELAKAYGAGDTDTINKKIGGRVQLKNLQAFNQDAINNVKNHLALDADNQKKVEGFSNRLATGLNGIDLGDGDDVGAAERANAFLHELHEEYPEYGGKMPQPGTLTADNYKDVIKHATALVGMTQGQLEAAAKVKKAENDASKAGQTTLAPGATLIETPTNPNAPINKLYTAPVNTPGLQPIGADKIPDVNKQFEDRWKANNDGPVPAEFVLPPNATKDDYERAHQMLQGIEAAKVTKAQNEANNSFRQSSIDIQRQNQADRESKDSQRWVTGTDPITGKEIAVSKAEADQRGIASPSDLGAADVSKVRSARSWLPIATQRTADPIKHPDEAGISQLVGVLDKKGALGPIASRWNDFVTGKIGSSELTKEPETARLYTALRDKLGLSTTLLMNVHVGSRGGVSLLDHFKQLADAGKMDANILKTGVDTEINYVKERAMQGLPLGNGQVPDRATIEKFHNEVGDDPKKIKELLVQHGWRLQ